MDLKTKLIFWQTWLASLLFFGGFYILTAQLPLYLAAARLPEWQIGFISGAFGISALIIRPPVGLLCDRVGPYKIIVGSVVLFLGGTLPLSLSTDLVFLLVLRSLQATGYVGFTTAGTTIVVKLIALPVRDRWVAWYGAAANVAVTFTPLALDLSNTSHNNAENSFNLAGLLALLGLGILIWNKGVPLKQGATSSSFNLYQSLKFVLWPLTFAFIAGVNFGVFLQFTPLLSQQDPSISSGLIYTSYGLSIILVRSLIWTTLNGAFQKIALPLGFSLTALGLAAFAFGSGYGFYLPGAALLAFGAGLQTPFLISMHLNALPATMQGRAVALYYFGFDGGIGLGSWLLTPFLALYGVKGLFSGAALTGLIGLIIWSGFKYRTGVKNAH
jgi:MFS family permease